MKAGVGHPPGGRGTERLLERIFGGWYSPVGFSDFLDLLETLLANAHAPGGDAEVDAAAFFAGKGSDPRGLRARLDSAGVQERMIQATRAVLDNAREPIYRNVGTPDVLGPAYCRLQANRRLGQFFTPAGVSRMIAAVAAGNIDADIRARVDRALEVAGLPPGRGVPCENLVSAHWDAISEALDPIRVLEPCVGSGGMLLAFASYVPPWALATGIVQFHAIDLDARALQMCSVNCLLYGVPVRLYRGNALAPALLSTVPQPFATAYSSVRRALESGDAAEAEAICKATIGYFPGIENLQAEQPG